MAVDDVANAIISIENDRSVASEVASGNFEPLGGIDLTDEERSLLREAASSDVEGFAAGYPTLGAYEYVAANRSSLSPAAKSAFTDFLGGRLGPGAAQMGAKV